MAHHHKKHEWTEERSERFIISVNKKQYKRRYIPIAKKIVYFMELANINANSRVVDIGCGPGFLLFEIHRILPKIEIIGIDASDLMISTAIENVKKKNILKFDFKKGYAENVPIQDKFTYVSICNNSLHDFKDWKKAIKEIFRILKPNGIFILRDRNGTYPKWKFFLLLFRIGLKNALRYFKASKRHLWLDPKITEEFMVDLGFQIIFSESKEHYIIVGKKIIKPT
ncbi:MAG: class I SAM-dependent methyltransferase [Candidatus Hodarchaeota archaeon]